MKTKNLISIAVILTAVFVSTPHSALAIAVGDRVQTTGAANVRQSAAGTAYANGQPSGALGTVISGPTTATLSGTSYVWWNINFDSGQDGWVASINITGAAVASPSISSVSPNPFTADAANGYQTLTIYGSNFVSKPTVAVTWTSGGTTLSSSQVTYVSSSQLTISIKLGASADNWTMKVTNPDGRASNTVGFTVLGPSLPSPSVSSVSPNPITADVANGYQTLTIYGSNFVSKPTVAMTWTSGGTTLSSSQVTYVSSTQLTLSIKLGASADTWTVKVTNPDGRVSNTVGFTVLGPSQPSPSISSVSPNPITADAANGYQTLTIYGSNFVSKPSITLTWTNQPGYALPASQVTFVSSTQLSVSVKLGAGADNWTVKATNPDGKSSGAAGFQVLNPPSSAPSISSVSPNPITADAANGYQTLTINGANFVSKPSITLTWTNQPGYALPASQVTFVSSTQLSISVKLGAGADNWTVKATNPDGKSSGAVGFQVLNPPSMAPSISSVSPNPITADPANGYQTVTINGANFVSKPSITLTWTNQPGYALPASQVTFVSSTQLTISIKLGASADNWTVKATNPDGKQSNVKSFTVNAPAAPSSDAYEPDDSPATAKTISNWQTQNRSIHAAGNADWATFTIGSNGATNVVIETAGTIGDTVMWLYGPNSSTTQAAYNDDGNGLFSRITLPTLSAGTYYIKVQAYANTSTIPAYTLRASWTDGSTPPNDGNDTPATATAVSNNQTVNAAINPLGDTDWYRFTVGTNGGTNAVIETAGTSGDTVMWLYGPNSTSMQAGYNDDGNGLFSRISLARLAAGTYYVKVQAFGNKTTIAAYALRAAWTDGTTPPSDGNDTSVTATAVTNNQTVNAAITPAGDTDWYRFTVGNNGGTNAVIETAGSSGDTEMWLYGPNSASTLAAYNDDGNGRFSRISRASLAAGTYYVKIQAFGNNSAIAAYTLRASWTDYSPGIVADSYEPDDSAAAAKAITNGQTQNRSIHAIGNVDWAKFTVPAGATNVRIETNGASGDTELWLYEPSNMAYAVGYDNDGGNGNFSLLTLPSIPAGTYYIKVQENGNDGTIPAYTLQATWTESSPPTTILPNVANTLNGDARSMKYYTVQVPAGQTGLDVRTWNGTGNADIYVGKDTLPSATDPTSYQGVSLGSTNNERVRLSSATPGTYNILVYGSAAYSGVKLKTTVGNPTRVVLLLHGMNSNVDTWEALMEDITNSFFDGGYWGKIFNGQITSSIPTPVSGIYYYALNFGGMDNSSGILGLNVNSGGNATGGQTTVSEDYTPPNPNDNDGDFSDFNRLGVEVLAAIQAIMQQHGQNVRIALVAHSRGGLAARAFLQRTSATSVVAKSTIEAALTLGTPHIGSRFGRFYEYLRTNPRNSSTSANSDWNFAASIWNPSLALFGKDGINLGEPTIKFLADNSQWMIELNGAVNEIPPGTQIGLLQFSGRTFGNLEPLGDVFDGQPYVISSKLSISIQDPSSDAKNYILDATTRDAQSGDGIVSAISQRWSNLPGWNGRQLEEWTGSTGIFHTAETDQTAAIIQHLQDLVDWW